MVRGGERRNTTEPLRQQERSKLAGHRPKTQPAIEIERAASRRPNDGAPAPPNALCAAGNRSTQGGTIPIDGPIGSIDRSIKAMCMPADSNGDPIDATSHRQAHRQPSSQSSSVTIRPHTGRCPGPPSTAAAACRRWSCRTRRSAAGACTVSSRPLLDHKTAITILPPIHPFILPSPTQHQPTIHHRQAVDRVPRNDLSNPFYWLNRPERPPARQAPPQRAHRHPQLPGQGLLGVCGTGSACCGLWVVFS